MIYKIVGEGYAGEPTAVEFKLTGTKVCISFEGETGTGMFSNVDAADLSSLLRSLKPKHSPNAKQLWVKPMSDAIQEILGGYGLIVAFKDGMDEMAYNSVAIEIIELIEALMITGKVPDTDYVGIKDGE